MYVCMHVCMYVYMYNIKTKHEPQGKEALGGRPGPLLHINIGTPPCFLTRAQHTHTHTHTHTRTHNTRTARQRGPRRAP
jgi:hypothetical protein